MKTPILTMTTEQTPSSSKTSNETEPQSFAERMTGWIRNLAKQKDEDLHEMLAELIDDQQAQAAEGSAGFADHEYQLLRNIVGLRERTVDDCMCPRADIVAIDAASDFASIVKFMTQEAHSRYPVYRENLDDVIGIIILKDVMAALANNESPNIDSLLRDVLYVPPSMPVMKLLLQMRQKRHHMAIVVDEYGGVDGLVTIEDLVEQIVGDIEDEHDEDDYASPTVKADGTLLVDGRMPLSELEEQLGKFLTDDERDEIDTVNGLALLLAGVVPARGTLLTHSSGVSFEVAEGDARRIKRLRVRKPAPKADSTTVVSLKQNKNG